MENKEGFCFTYSAAQRQEVENIRKKYLPKEEDDKLEQLRRLHRSSGQKAQAWAIAVGVIGSLLLGTGMSLFMTDLGAALGNLALVIGIGVGVVGMVLIAQAYPVYDRVKKKERKRIAPQILQLTEELLK